MKWVTRSHVHVERDRAVAKFSLELFGLAYSRLFPAHELRRIQAMVRERSDQFTEAWNGFFRR